MDSQIRKRLIHSVDYIACTGVNGRGTKTFASATTLKCYKEGKISTVIGLDGEQKISSIRLYFDGVLTIDTRDEFVIAGRTYPVLAVNPFDGLKPNTGTTVVYV